MRKFLHDHFEKIVAEENLVKLQAVEKYLNQFKSRFLELQYLQDIGPVTFWKLYNSIIDKVNMKKAAKLNEHEINLFQRLKALKMLLTFESLTTITTSSD
jgi:hypothetical protein